MEIGVDCIEICRFDGIVTDKKLQERLFTHNEIDYCLGKKNPTRHFAVRFAGKEAVIKALSNLNITIGFDKIEILNDTHGRPFVNLLNEKYKDIKIKISLSHSDTVAISFAIII